MSSSSPVPGIGSRWSLSAIDIEPAAFAIRVTGNKARLHNHHPTTAASSQKPTERPARIKATFLSDLSVGISDSAVNSTSDCGSSGAVPLSAA